MWTQVFNARDVLRDYGFWFAYADQRETLRHSRVRALWIIWLAINVERHRKSGGSWRA